MPKESPISAFSEYIIQNGDVSRRVRAENWCIAIGLQGVDNLATSPCLLDVARDQIEGRLDFAEVEKRITAYYKTEEGRALAERRADEADLVATHIAELLAEDTFTLSPAEYAGIHKRLFTGVFKHAGTYRTENISKSEWVLDNRSVLYSSAPMISAAIIHDFDREKNFSYKGLSRTDIVSHIVDFISGLWEIHPFYEGNTRTTAVFTIRYLRKFGFKADNDLFKEHALYFRNALVRAVYSNYQYNIAPDKIFLERFFENLLFNGHHKLLNRHCHIYWQETDESQNVGVNVGVNEKILEAMKLNPSVRLAQIAEALNLNKRHIERLVSKLKKEGRVQRVGSDKTGHWEVIDA